ncbi:UNKNOWN [Stylonychia lemnae]|uniref:Uncharacterized protein n=1 Tax=Stylonychia lemnae TaxID=5949 RepID=A0A078B991_STYLE|nr:UNKNOWN [Stylonychia lemnae]|eukprot:CDW90949.1 UNKNOWN [Stylonychia lemnae]
MTSNISSISNMYPVNRIQFTQHPPKSGSNRPGRVHSNNSNTSQNNHSNPPRPKNIISDRNPIINNEKYRKRKISYESINNSQNQINNSQNNINHSNIINTSSNTPSIQHICYDKEIKLIIKRSKHENVFVPELKELNRILYLIQNCKSAAYELYQFLINSSWKYFRRWIQNAQKSSYSQVISDQRRTILLIIEKLISIANNDFKKDPFVRNNSELNTISANHSQRSSSYNNKPTNNGAGQNNSGFLDQKPVLQNITNTYQLRKDQTPSSRLNNTKLPLGKITNLSRDRPSSNHGGSSSFQNYIRSQVTNTSNYVECCATPLHQQQLFKKSDVQALVNNKSIVDIIACYVRPLRHYDQQSLVQIVEEKKQIEALIGQMIEITLEFKDRELYDELSLSFIKADIFSSLIRFIIYSPIEAVEYKSVARIFELCACHQEGIQVLSKYLKNIVELVDLFMQSKNDLISVKYPAATVLLDLTANENCIEKVAFLIKDKDLFDVILVELEESLQRKVPKNSPNKVYLNRFRDLMIGIVLNLTCNVESEEITEYMVRKDVIRVLKDILQDTRHDWPTNGAALALLQYAHLSLSNAEMYMKLEENQIQELMMKFVNECKKKETKRHIYETITLISMSKQKMESISKIIRDQCYAACA